MNEGDTDFFKGPGVEVALGEYPQIKVNMGPDRNRRGSYAYSSDSDRHRAESPGETPGGGEPDIVVGIVTNRLSLGHGQSTGDCANLSRPKAHASIVAHL